MNRMHYFKTIAILAVLSIICGCGGGGSSSVEYAKWDFSGYVVDGATNVRLSGAKIEYLDADGVQAEVVSDPSGAFFVSGLAYGQKVFRISCLGVRGGDTVQYAERLIQASSMTESSLMEGVLANGSRLLKLYPLTGSFHGEVMIKAKGSGKLLPAQGVTLHLQYRDSTFVNATPDDFNVVADSLGRFQFVRLPADTNMTLTVNAYDYNGTRYVASPQFLPRLQASQDLDVGRFVLDADTASGSEDPVLSSNVLDGDGVGLVGISADLDPYYLLSVELDPARLDVQVSANDSTLDAVPEFRGDTLFLRHTAPFPTNSFIQVEVTGVSMSGARVFLDLGGVRCFKTGRPLHAVASNTWRGGGNFRSEFALFDTLWVVYSEALGSVSQLQWSKVTTGKTLYGFGSVANSQAWVSGDTLFVIPDQRFQATGGDPFGFNVTVANVAGQLSTPTEITSVFATTVYSTQWTNAKDLLGNTRTDMGVLDSIIVVANRPIASVTGVSVADSASLPPGFTLSDVSIRGGDTLVYKPQVAMAPGTLYGMDFDVTTPDGKAYANTMAVKWKTAYQVKIVAVNNRENLGYRRFKALGDSLVVQFSKAIDTSASATNPFAVHMTDVKGSLVQTHVHWNSARTIATILNVTPFPLADYGVTNTTTTAGDKAKAVASVTFDFATADGEVVFGLKPEAEPIKIYTEEGLCVVNTNVVKNHVSLYEVNSSETPREDFPLDSAVRITFNRILDTAYIQLGTSSSFGAIQSGLGVNIAATISFEDGGKTMVIKPSANLPGASEYWIKLARVPALGLRDAAGIGVHSGTYSGTSTTSSYLLITGFSTP
jgi:hypothetical protein